MNPEDILPPEPPAAPEQPAPASTVAPDIPATATAPTPKGRVSNILPVTQQGERTLRVLKRHPIGIYSVYIMCGLALVMTATLAFGVIPEIAHGSSAILIGAIVFLVVLAVCVTSSLIARKVYWGNTWTLTTDSITQVNQVSLFTRQSSQLSLADLEDVTSEQNGILAEMFNFGLLRVETAGERSKFMFPYCPNPNYYAQQILAAREAFDETRRLEEGASSGSAQPPPASDAAMPAAFVPAPAAASPAAQPAAAPASAPLSPMTALPAFGAAAVQPPPAAAQPPVSVQPLEAGLTEDEAVAQAFKLPPAGAVETPPLPSESPLQPPPPEVPVPGASLSPQPAAVAPLPAPSAISDTPQVPTPQPPQSSAG